MSVLVKEPEAIMQTVQGFSADTVRAHSAARNEPAWMLEFRLDAWRQFEAMPWPEPTDEAWRRTRLTGFDLKNFKPVATASGKVKKGELSRLLQEELNEMDSAASMVFEDSGLRNSVFHTRLEEHGVIFADLQSAVQQHPDLVRKYFMTKPSCLA
jgi:Fe-S cluster assembly scaffold protein SufB